MQAAEKAEKSSDNTSDGAQADVAPADGASVDGIEAGGDHPLSILQDTLTRLYDFTMQLIPNLIFAAMILFITWLISKYAVRTGMRLVKETNIRPRIRDLIVTLAKLVTWTVGLLVAAMVVVPGLTPSSIITGLGFGALAASFAFKDLMENLVAGVFIMLREKMQIGDQIECTDINGDVEHITIRETYIRKRSGELTIVPNTVLFKNPVKILTDGDKRRYQLTVTVAYATDLKQASDLILKSIKACKGIYFDKPIDIYAKEFNDDYISFLVRWWGESKNHYNHVTTDLVLREIKLALDKAGIEFSDPDSVEIVK